MVKLSAMTTACRTSSCLNSSRFETFFFDMAADICNLASWEIVTVEPIKMKGLNFISTVTNLHSNEYLITVFMKNCVVYINRSIWIVLTTL